MRQVLSQGAVPVTSVHTAEADGVKVFYRAAGDPSAPVVLLLHGFPTSSFMFRELIPRLADQYRVIAPDLPGFGFTEVPVERKYTYSFDALARTLEAFTNAAGLNYYALYAFDYGAPTGFRLAMAHPERVSAIISQNGNAYEEGLGEAWAPIRKYWADPTAENREVIRENILTMEGTRWQYTHGVASPESIAPESYTLDAALLERPGNKEIQLDLFLNYASNVRLYPQFQEYFRQTKPPLLAIWGKNDPFFIPAGAQAFQKDLPNAKIQFLDTGHFATETHVVEIAGAMREFLEEEKFMERRTGLGGLTAASVSALSQASSSESASSQARSHSSAPSDFSGFRASEIKTKDNTVFLRTDGKGPGLLLVHGFPRTHLMWRHLAPQMTDRYTVVCVDLRGYGHSGSPVSTDDHFPYSKRAMASELVEVMEQLGFTRFSVVGHDRGGRVSYRMAIDHPEKVEKLAVFDVIPILEGWSRADAKFAQTYWPWILLSQKNPLPEKYLLGAPEAVFDNPFGAGSFAAEIREQYIEMYRDPVRVHAVCEEYRAAATIDVEHDRNDLETNHQIKCPMLHLWAAGGPLDTFYANAGGPLGIWRRWAANVQGQAMSGGHFFPEENPTDTAELLRKFLFS